jgi:hypothetical protein
MGEHFSTFRGSVLVRSTPHGYSVRFDPGSETDAHDLGHALAAIITTYIKRVEKAYPLCDEREVTETVLSGIQCGLHYNPEPSKRN